MLRGLTTVNFFADDLTAAQDWYATLFGIQPYFVREVAGAPAYIEFRIGDYQHELGLIDRRFAAHGHRQALLGNPRDAGRRARSTWSRVNRHGTVVAAARS